jgi:predicted transcriptional regulator
MQDTFEKEAILDRLMKKMTLADWQPGTERAKMIAQVRHIPESSVNIYLKDLYALTLQVQNIATSFTDQMTRLVKQVPHPPPP